MVLKVLVISANPRDQEHLKLGKEFEIIENVRKSSTYRSEIIIDNLAEVMPNTFAKELLDKKPDILHFCGHATKLGNLIFEKEDGSSTEVNLDIIQTIVDILGDSLKLIVLNACFSTIQAEKLANRINCIVGTTTKVKDIIALNFSDEFYRLIFEGKTVSDALQLTEFFLRKFKDSYLDGNRSYEILPSPFDQNCNLPLIGKPLNLLEHLNKCVSIFNSVKSVDQRHLKDNYVENKLIEVHYKDLEIEDFLKDNYVENKLIEENYNTWKIEDFLKDDDVWWCFIVAPFGMGKSCFVKFHVSRLAAQKLNKQSEYVPIFMTGDSIITEDNIQDLDLHLIEIATKESYLLLLFDGLDEIRKPEILGRFLEHLKEIKKNYQRLKVIFTTRTILGLGSLETNKYVSLLRFDDVEAGKFFDKYQKQ